MTYVRNSSGKETVKMDFREMGCERTFADSRLDVMVGFYNDTDGL
jgi:hypothetical protein